MLKIRIIIQRKKLRIKISPSKPLEIVIERMMMLRIPNFKKENRVK